jgi:hypothetical protein
MIDDPVNLSWGETGDFALCVTAPWRSTKEYGGGK